MARTKNRFNAVNTEPEEIVPVQESWRTALYARLSVELASRRSESIENQWELMRKFTAGKPEFAELFEYTDKGFSGTDFHRPAFESMMADVRSGKINCIIVKDLSRLGRDYLETSNLIETIFPFLGVRFIAVNDHFDTNEEHNGNKELEIALKNLVNDMYARDVSRRVSSARKQDQIRGKFMGSNAPYGYKRDENHPLRQLIIDEPAAEIVRSIYGMVLDGLSLREISLKLQEQKLSIPGQYFRTGHLYREPEDEVKKWYIGTVSNILHSQAYIGNLVQGRRKTRHYKGEERHFTSKDEWIIIEDTHEPIVSKEVFEEVQRILSRKVENSCFASERTRDIPVKPNRFKGILYCGICGEKLGYASIVPDRPETERRYYFACSKNYDINIEKHTGIHITEVTLEAILKELIGDLLRRFDAMDHQLTATMEKELKAGLAVWRKDIRKVEHKLTDMDAVSASAYEAYVLGTISKEEYLAGRSTAEEQREILELEVHQLQEKSAVYEAGIRAKLRWLLGLSKASEGELDSDLIHLLIDRIELYPRHELQITWRFSEADIMRKDGE